MSLRVGEIARETGTFRCDDCGERIRVVQGAVVNECPQCRGPSFQMARRGAHQPSPEAYGLRGDQGSGAPVQEPQGQ
jgi:predicted RNA-binding Zn-ribbon protein involved in translation (DUF1610 family)